MLLLRNSVCLLIALTLESPVVEPKLNPYQPDYLAPNLAPIAKEGRFKRLLMLSGGL